MAQFYGSIKGQRGEATRLGGKGSGMRAIAAGWGGAINTRIWHDETTHKDMFRVELTPWRSSGGDGYVLAEGELDAHIDPTKGELELVYDYKGRPYFNARRKVV